MNLKSLSSYLRDFGGTEEFTDACMVHRNLCMGTSVRFTTKKSFNFEDVQTALRRLQYAHLQLQCVKKIDNIPSKGWKLFGSNIPVPKPQFHKTSKKIGLEWITISDDEDAEVSTLHCLENLIQSTFTEGSLLWKAYLITVNKGPANQGILSIVSHPALNDSTGVIGLLGEFLKHLSIVLRDEAEALQINRSTDLHLTLEGSIDVNSYGNYSWSEAIGYVLHIGSCVWNRSRGEYIRRFPIPIVPDYTTRYIGFTITENQSKQILQKLRAEHCSIRSFFTAIGLAGMHSIITKIDKEIEALQLWTTHEMNLRQFCKSELDCKYGCYCTYLEEPVETKCVRNSNELWDLVHHCQMVIEPKMSSDNQMKMIKFFQKNLAGNPYGFFKSLGVINEVRNDFGVAVYENLELETRQITVNSIIPMTSIHSMGCPFKHTVTVVGELVLYNLTWCGNYVTEDQAMNYGKETMKFLQLALD